MQFTYQAPDGSQHTLHLTKQQDGSYQVTMGENHYQARLHNIRDTLVLTVNGQNYRLYAHREGTSIYLSLDGQAATLQKIVAGGRGSPGAGGDVNPIATMPGLVTALLVEVGQEVEKGQTLLLMEAMKMEMRVKAPHSGRVKTILCEAGKTVDRGQLLIELEAI